MINIIIMIRRCGSVWTERSPVISELILTWKLADGLTARSRVSWSQQGQLMSLITGNHVYLIPAVGDNGSISDGLLNVTIMYLWEMVVRMCKGEAVRLSS